jgi:DNA mismatch endonuclease (patch repair protein)
MILRRGLHGLGWRYRLHDRRLPGKPDMVFSGQGAVILVNGCFWHGHKCHLFRWPQSRPEFWREKIGGNIRRDRRTLGELNDLGWRVAEVWECALKGRLKLPVVDLLAQIADWLRSDRTYMAVPESGPDDRQAI